MRGGASADERTALTGEGRSPEGVIGCGGVISAVWAPRRSAGAAGGWLVGAWSSGAGPPALAVTADEDRVSP